MEWILVKEERISFAVVQMTLKARFHSLVSIWRSRCHILNRRLSGIVEVEKNSVDYYRVLSTCGLTNSSGVQLKVYRSVPRSGIFSTNSYEASISTDDLSVEFYPCTFDEKRNPHLSFSYKFVMKECPEILDDGTKLADLLLFKQDDDADCKWLRVVVFPRLIRWLRGMDNYRSSYANENLIDIIDYSRTYQSLKNQWGHSIANNWTEKTDPKKFVYEDCGIASYLKVLWRNQPNFPRRFCDVGCGNGLLVYLLNKLEVEGFGIDVRSRAIWSELKSAELHEYSLNPELIIQSDDHLGVFQDVDYLIGNHCDELTPWIAVISAKLRCDFFLLPCCPYDFYGRYCKKITNNSGNSSCYSSYLDYLQQICVRLGYEVRIDRLKIPSTKRICLVCSLQDRQRTEADEINEKIKELLIESVQSKNVFVPREKICQGRNYTRIPHDSREAIVKKIFFQLLGSSESTSAWRRGRTCEIVDIADQLDSDEKNLMKYSAGGLQTFLKNQHQIFEVCSGKACIRDWTAVGRRNVEGKFKTRMCWFEANHPDGCPLSDGECSYRHSVPQ